MSRKTYSVPVQAARQFIKENLHRRITWGVISRVMGMPAVRANHAFKYETGMTIKNFVAHQQIKRAKRLIGRRHARLALADVAQQCGFDSHQHLSTRFKQLTGKTPTSCRPRT